MAFVWIDLKNLNECKFTYHLSQMSMLTGTGIIFQGYHRSIDLSLHPET